MIAVDTNVLIYAHRRHLAEHALALKWLTHLCAGTAPWGLPVFCLGEFLRVATHPRVFAPASTPIQAWAAANALLAAPSTRLLLPGPHHAALLEEDMRQAGATGNLVFDAQIAATCREHGVDRLLTADRDFSRFKHLRLLSLADPPA